MVSHCFIIALMCALAGTTTAQDAYATATLNGANSIPPIKTPTTASFFMGNVVGDQVQWTLNIKDIKDLIMAHIHSGNATTNGPPVVNLVPLSSQKAVKNSLGLMQLATPESGNNNTYISTFTPEDFMNKNMTMAKLISDLAAGNLYVNVHTSADVPGLIRGQLGLGGDVPSSAQMTSSLFTGIFATVVSLALFF